jgi:hypothetical protein
MTDYCDVTKPTEHGELRCDLPPGHSGDKHATGLMNPFFPGKVAFIHEWTTEPA